MQAVAEFAKQQRLDTWKRNMLKGGREATKCLNNHANVVSPSLLYDSGGRRVSTYGPNDSLEQLKGFWDSIWYRYSMSLWTSLCSSGSGRGADPS